MREKHTEQLDLPTCVHCGEEFTRKASRKRHKCTVLRATAYFCLDDEERKLVFNLQQKGTKGICPWCVKPYKKLRDHFWWAHSPQVTSIEQKIARVEAEVAADFGREPFGPLLGKRPRMLREAPPAPTKIVNVQQEEAQNTDASSLARIMCVQTKPSDTAADAGDVPEISSDEADEP
jgi:hypothetical protein